MTIIPTRPSISERRRRRREAIVVVLGLAFIAAIIGLTMYGALACGANEGIVQCLRN